MTTNDKELIQKAYSTQDHQKVGRMIDLAESDEAKEIIRGWESVLYHQEEYIAGTL